MRKKAAVLFLCSLMAALSGFSGTMEAKKSKLVIWSNGWTPFETYRKILKGFEKTHPNVTVEVLPQIDRAKLLFGIATGTAPDLVTLVTPISELSDRNLLTPLNSYLKTSRVIKSGDYRDELLDIFSTDGKIYAIPSIEVGEWTSLIYNRTAFEEAGLSPDVPVRSFEDLMLAHRKLTKIQNDKITRLGFNPTGSMGGLYFPETWGPLFGATTVNRKTRRISYDTPEMLKAVEYCNSFYDICTPQTLSSWWGKAGDWGKSIANGSLAMEMNGYWTPGQVNGANKSKVKVSTYWMPNVKGDKMMAYGGWSLAIPRGCKQTQLAFEFIEYMTTKEPAQAIFDNLGFLNGNRKSLRELNLSAHPEVKWFITAHENADRIVTTPDVPTWDRARQYLLSGVQESLQRRKVAPAQMLKNVQKQVDIELDKYYKQVKK